MLSRILELLISFFQIGLFSIGGGYATIPLIQEQVVSLHGWLSFQEFTDIITISQMTPGPIAVNTSTFVGLRIAGVPGAMAATFGCVISGFVISLFLYRFFRKHQGAPAVEGVLQGLRSASVGLIAAAACTIVCIALWGTTDWQAGQFNLKALVLLLPALAVFRKWKPNPILVIVCCGILGIVLYR